MLIGYKIMAMLMCTAVVSTAVPSTSEASDVDKPKFNVGSFSMNISNIAEKYEYKVETAPRSVQVRSSDVLKEYALTNEDKVKLVCGNVITYDEFTSKSYSQLESKLSELERQMHTSVKVKVWKWKEPDTSNMEKVSGYVTMQVNKAIADIVVSAFSEIYSDKSKPVVEFGGGYVRRAKNNAGGSVTASIHAYGAALDFNTSNSTLKNSDGETLTNWNSGDRVFASTEAWSKLPECQAKYNILYEDSVIVKVLKKYGFAWGGDWSPTYRDGMHFQWIDG